MSDKIKLRETCEGTMSDPLKCVILNYYCVKNNLNVICS